MPSGHAFYSTKSPVPMRCRLFFCDDGCRRSKRYAVGETFTERVKCGMKL